MPNLITFIAKPTQLVLTADGEPSGDVRYARYSMKELKAQWEQHPDRFFQVTQSHADQVLCRQEAYQEIYPDQLIELKVAKPAPRRRASPRKAKASADATPE